MTEDDNITQKCGRVSVNELGPHFYVKSGSFEGRYPPTGFPDILFGAMHDELKNKFGDLKNVSWVRHIYPHTPFASVWWEEDSDGNYVSNSIEIEIDDKNDEWYSSNDLYDDEPDLHYVGDE